MGEAVAARQGAVLRARAVVARLALLERQLALARTQVHFAKASKVSFAGLVLLESAQGRAPPPDLPVSVPVKVQRARRARLRPAAFARAWRVLPAESRPPVLVLVLESAPTAGAKRARRFRAARRGVPAWKASGAELPPPERKEAGRAAPPGRPASVRARGPVRRRVGADSRWGRW